MTDTNKRTAAEKEVAELRAQLEGIRSVTTCAVAEAEPDAEADEGREPASDPFDD